MKKLFKGAFSDSMRRDIVFIESENIHDNNNRKSNSTTSTVEEQGGNDTTFLAVYYMKIAMLF